MILLYNRLLYKRFLLYLEICVEVDKVDDNSDDDPDGKDESDGALLGRVLPIVIQVIQVNGHLKVGPSLCKRKDGQLYI